MSVDSSYRPGFNNCDQVNALCPVEASTYGDYFNLGACIFYTTFYAIALIYTTVVGIRGRTWTFSIFLAIGIVLELMGYAARIAMSPIGTVWNYGAFVIQLVMLILAPTLVAAAISVTFKWIVIQKGVKYSVLRPNLYPWIFVGCDFLSIIIQAIGGAISATATGGETNAKLLDVGSDLLVAGVAFQVSQSCSCTCPANCQAANMAFCGGFMVIYWWRYRRACIRGELNDEPEATTVRTPNDVDSQAPEQGVPVGNATITSVEGGTLRAGDKGRNFTLFIYALLVAYIAVLVRCIYR